LCLRIAGISEVFMIAFVERILAVIRFNLSYDPGLCVSSVREADGGPYRGAKLAQDDTVTPVVLNKDLITC